jgi:dipeptidase E
MGLLEITALSSIDRDTWLPAIKETDALLVWGGDPLYLAYWFEQSGLVAALNSLNKNIVYVGVSAGSMVASTIFGETYSAPRAGSGTPLTSENMLFNIDGREISRTYLTAKGAGFVDFAIIPHFNNPNHPDACGQNAERWAAKVPVPVYAIDEQTAIKVVEDQVQVISEGTWKLFNIPPA